MGGRTERGRTVRARHRQLRKLESVIIALLGEGRVF